MKTRAEGGRGKDGMFSRFILAMDEIVGLTPNFQSSFEATKYYSHFTKLKRFSDYKPTSRLPDEVVIDRSYYRCTSHVEYGLDKITLSTRRGNPLEVLHILAHYVQPPNSPWHRGEFAATFLDFVERSFDADMRRQVKDIMFEKRLPLFAKSESSRLKQSEAYYTKRAGQIPQGLVDILADIREIRS